MLVFFRESDLTVTIMNDSTAVSYFLLLVVWVVESVNGGLCEKKIKLNKNGMRKGAF